MARGPCFARLTAELIRGVRAVAVHAPQQTRRVIVVVGRRMMAVNPVRFRVADRRMLPQERDSLLHGARGNAGQFELAVAVTTEQFPPHGAHPTPCLRSVRSCGAWLELNEEFAGDELRRRALRLHD